MKVKELLELYKSDSDFAESELMVFCATEGISLDIVGINFERVSNTIYIKVEGCENND